MCCGSCHCMNDLGLFDDSSSDNWGTCVSALYLACSSGSSEWGSASSHSLSRLGNTYMIGSADFQNSGPTIKLLSHSFISFDEWIQLIWDGGVIGGQNWNMLFLWSNLFSQIGHVLDAGFIWSLEFLQIDLHTIDSSLSTVVLEGLVVDLGQEFLILYWFGLKFATKVIIFASCFFTAGLCTLILAHGSVNLTLQSLDIGAHLAVSSLKSSAVFFPVGERSFKVIYFIRFNEVLALACAHLHL